MGPLLVLVSPCFRENVVVACKIGCFLCSFNNFLQKKRNCLLFWKSNFKMALIWKKKKGYFWPTFHIFQSPGKSYKKSFGTYLTHIHTCILLTLLTFCLTNFDENTNLWFLFGMIPGVDSYSRHFGTINITKWWAKFKLECLLLKCIYAKAKFIVICKPWT